MSIRRDKIQLDVEINGQKAGKTYRELINDSRNLKRELLQLTPGTAAFIKKTEELKKVNGRLAEIRRQTRGATKESTTLAGTFKKFLPALGAAAIVAGIVRIGRSLFSLGAESLKLFNIQAKADAQLRAGLESTRGAAGRTFEELKRQAADLQKITLFGDEQIQQAQSILLTFTKIEGGIYDQAVPAILDMATKLDVDLKSASIQVGKALNDPIKGVTALSRAGVQFSEDQKKTIKRLQETGDIAAAQTVILKELETQFRGSAEAAGGAGLGAYTKLQNRLSDIKESVGVLITNGLNRLAPAFEVVVSFLEKFVGSLISGDKATGKLSTGVNALVGFFKVLSGIIRLVTTPTIFLWKLMVNVSTAIFNLIEAGSKIPIIGRAISVLIAPLKLLYQALSEGAATFEGLRAAAAQAVESIKSQFTSLATSAQLLKLKLQKALSISPETRARLAQEIKDLENLKLEAGQAGKTIGEAYTEARNKAIAANKIANQSATPSAFGTPINIPGAANTQNPTANSQNPTANTQQPTANTKEDKLKSQLDAIKESGRIQLEQLKIQRLQEEITEQEYAERTNRAQRDNLGQRIEILKQHGKDTETLQREQLELVEGFNKQQIESQLADIEAAGAGELSALQTKFLNRILTEQQFEEQSLQNKADFIQRKLDLLTNLGLQETDAFRKLQQEQLDVQKQTDAKKLENARRTAEMKMALQRGAVETLKGALDFGIEALKRDETARKKHASAIKAFELGKVAVNLASELSGIYKSYSGLGPIGIAIGVVQAGIAVARSVNQANKIRRQKFYRGGYTGDEAIFHDGQDGVVDADVHVGEYVSPKWQVRHPVYGRVIRWLDKARTGKVRTSFMDGGFAGITDVDTSPIGLTGLPLAQTSTATQDLSGLYSRLDKVVDVLLKPQKIKASVSINDIEDTFSELNEIRNTAGF